MKKFNFQVMHRTINFKKKMTFSIYFIVLLFYCRLLKANTIAINDDTFFEPITCHTISSVHIGHVISAGKIKMISEAMYSGSRVLVIQPHNSTWFNENKDNPEVYTEFIIYYLSLKSFFLLLLLIFKLLISVSSKWLCDFFFMCVCSLQRI